MRYYNREWKSKSIENDHIIMTTLKLRWYHHSNLQLSPHHVHFFFPSKYHTGERETVTEDWISSEEKNKNPLTVQRRHCLTKWEGSSCLDHVNLDTSTMENKTIRLKKQLKYSKSKLRNTAAIGHCHNSSWFMFYLDASFLFLSRWQ